MAKIVRLTEKDLTRLVRRVIKEQFTDDDFEFNTTIRNDRGDLEHEHNDLMVMLMGKSSRQVQRLFSNLSENVRYITIIDCEYADFSNIDLCEYSNLRFVKVQGTPNNFEETQDDCYRNSDYGFEFNFTIRNDYEVMLQGKSSKQVQRALSNLSEKIRYIAFPHCEYADFSDVNLCEYPDLRVVNLKETPNNLKETQDGCYDDIGGGMYEFSHGE